MANLHQTGSQVYRQDLADPEVTVICCYEEVVFECEICPWGSPPPGGARWGFSLPERPVSEIGVVWRERNNVKRDWPLSGTIGLDRKTRTSLGDGLRSA